MGTRTRRKVRKSTMNRKFDEKVKKHILGTLDPQKVVKRGVTVGRDHFGPKAPERPFKRCPEQPKPSITISYDLSWWLNSTWGTENFYRKLTSFWPYLLINQHEKLNCGIQ